MLKQAGGAIMKINYLIICTFIGSLHTINLASNSSIIGGFLPYWRPNQSIETFKKHYQVFDQASPFSYDVDEHGHIIDHFHRKKELWEKFTIFCHNHHIKVVPTLFWNNAEALHEHLSDTKKSTGHIDEIMHVVMRDHCDGICIDYENIHAQDRLHFAHFIKNIALKLHEKNLVLHCCLEGRISDYHTGLFLPKGHQSPAVANAGPTISRLGTPQAIHHFKKNCARYCDQIIIMGYDEWGFPYQYNSNDYTKKYFISHASIAWLKRIIRYTLSFIPAEKLVLGIPTYGLDFIIYSMNKHDIELKKHKALSFPTIQELLQEHKCNPYRTSGCELACTYHADNLLHYVCYLDAQAIKDRIELARYFHLKGVYFFKIDGLEDPTMWTALRKKMV